MRRSTPERRAALERLEATPMTGIEFHAALERLGLSLAEAARRLGVNYTTLWRQAHRGPTLVDGPYAAAVTCWLERGKKAFNTQETQPND